MLLGVLMAATCVEKVWGTGWVVRYVYGASWFAVCWAVTAVAAILYLIGRRVQKHRATFCLHLSFAVILLGALVTHVWGVQGRVHLRKGGTESSFTASDGRWYLCLLHWCWMTSGWSIIRVHRHQATL